MPTVTIGCRLPQGFIMELIEPGKMNYPLPRSKNATKINGTNSLMVGKIVPIGQCALTEVDETLATEWFKRNADLSFVETGAVFIQKTVASAKDAGKERAGLITGFEPIDPKGDPRMAGVGADKDHLKRMGVAA